MRAAYAVEWLKLRRSRVVAVATVGLLLAPALLARGFQAAAARGGGDPMSVKADALVSGEGWTAFVGGLVQIYATGGLLGVGIVVGWCFGREYADRTVVSLYASATPRDQVARAKLVLLAGWATAVAFGVTVTALALGIVTGLGLPAATDLTDLARLGVLAILTGLLALPVALAASLGRGYLAAFGGLLALIVVAQVAVVAGVGTWWPWSAPAVWAMAGPATGLPVVSVWRLLVVPLTVVAAGAATLAWWRRAEVA